MIITTAHAKQYGWQKIDFDDGLGAVCAWNPEFRYRLRDAPKKQIPWSSLPVGTRVVDVWNTDLEYRGICRDGSLTFEYRNPKYNTVAFVDRFPSQLAKLSAEQNWLPNPVFPAGVLWYSHETLDGLKCVVRIADGYELC
jgi:hypothetical protein